MLLIAEIFLVLFCIVAGAGIYLYQKTFGSLQKIEFSEDEVMNVELSEEQLDFGSMEGRKKAQKKLTITNTGKTTLHIRQVQVFNKSLSVSLGDRTLEPGKSTRLKVTVNTKYLKKAKARPRVLLISDDPENAKKIINIHVTP